MNAQDIESLYNEIKNLLQHKAEELRLQELLKDIDAKRADWQRRSALFVPSRNRLERGGRALELGELYETIKELRIQRDKLKIRQSSLRDDLTEARTALQNSEEALTLIEAEYRDKLTEQTKLANIAQKVKTLDEQIIDRTEAAIQAGKEFMEAEQRLKECTARVETEQTALEKVEVALREARKFLQHHSIDEKLITGLSGIQKCFTMYENAEDKLTALKESWAKALLRKQQAQSIFNDRSAMVLETNHRYAVLEKNFARARAFYESTLKGHSIAEWRDIAARSITRLAGLDEIYSKFQELRDLEDKLKNMQETRTRLQKETRNLNIRDVEQAGKLHELQLEVERLEKRVALLHRIEDLDAVRELLQDNAPCPLCGSMSHPYTSGSLVPDPEEVHEQLSVSQAKLNELKDELSTRQTRTGRLNDDIASIARDESELRTRINALNADISTRVSLLGLKFSAGISPFDELDRERQKTRDNLQLARNAADTAEAAEHDMKAAEDELNKIKETRSEVTRFYQDALFALQNEKSDEERLSSECKAQEEIVSTLKRELSSQIMTYGYKSLPDKNPGEVVDALSKRLTAWQDGAKLSDELERELSSSSAKLASTKKERESLRQKREELASRMKAVEAERDTVKQQRVILFESRNPDDEQDRMSQTVESLRVQVNERREAKLEKSAELEQIQTALHTLETEQALGREDLQRNEIAFSKKLLALGFRNEDDYASALLTSDERRDLQAKLRELTQTDFDLATERENTRAKILELQSDGRSVDSAELNEKIKTLKAEIDDFMTNNTEDSAFRERLSQSIIPTLKTLMLTCALEEVF